MKLLRRLSAWAASPGVFPLFLLGLCLLAYAPLLPRLGLYWDDFPMNWIASTMGREGLARYFSTNRPVWGLLYQFTTTLIGSTPLPWHILALLLRWSAGLVLWQLLRRLWPGRASFAAWAAMTFVIYPGFSQHFIAFLYSHFYIVLICFLLSLLLMVLAVQNPRRRLPLTVLALALGLFQMLAMEYFLLLDLLRPLLLWVAFNGQASGKLRLRRALLAWLPYLLLFLGAIFWRSVLFGFQTYQPVFMEQLKANPLQAVGALLPVMFNDIWNNFAGAWAQAFVLPDPALVGAANIQRYWILVAAGVVFAALFGLLRWLGQQANKPESSARGWLLQPLLIGLAAVAIAGGPFWLTGLQIGLVFPNDRFTLPFLIGVSLLSAALLQALPLPGWTKPLLAAVAVGFTVGLHYQSAVVYNRDWSVQRSMFWQMTWRIPALQTGTALLSNELPVVHYTDNSLSAPLNWIYDPNNNPAQMRYILLYPTLRNDSLLGGLQPGYDYQLDYLATTFYGSTDQLLVVYYQPPGCLRVLDPEVEQENWTVPVYLREALHRSNPALILPAPPAGQPAARPPERIYGPEITAGWCYYYEQADLARQFSQWQTVVDLGEAAWSKGDYPNDPIERFPFIEGYAHTGSWTRALELSREAVTVTPVMNQPLCRLWGRIARQTGADARQVEALSTVRAEFGCTGIP